MHDEYKQIGTSAVLSTEFKCRSEGHVKPLHRKERGEEEAGIRDGQTRLQGDGDLGDREMFVPSSAESTHPPQAPDVEAGEEADTTAKGPPSQGALRRSSSGQE